MATVDLQRFSPMYMDALGDVRTALSGAAVWQVEKYFDGADADTGLILPFLRHDQDDSFQIILQFNHTKKLGTNLGDLHIHYVPAVRPTAASENAYFEIKYLWITAGNSMANTNWTTTNATITINQGDEHKEYIANLLTNITVPTSEGYSSILFAIIKRLGTNVSDTYNTDKVVPPASGLTAAANLGILYVDAHYQCDRLGSFTTIADS